MKRQSPTRHPRWAIGPLLLAISLACLPGCYERVVSAKGIGADAYTTSEPSSIRDRKTPDYNKKKSTRPQTPLNK